MPEGATRGGDLQQPVHKSAGFCEPKMAMELLKCCCGHLAKAALHRASTAMSQCFMS